MSKKIEIDMSEKLANIVKNYSGLNNLVMPPPIVQIMNALADIYTMPFEDIEISAGKPVGNATEYTMTFTVKGNDPFSITFLVPNGQKGNDGAYVQSVEVIDV